MQSRLLAFWKSATITLLAASVVFSTHAQQAYEMATNQMPTKANDVDTNRLSVNLSKDDKFKVLTDKIIKMDGDPRRNWDDYEQTARELIKEFPERPDGYDALITEMQLGDRNKATALAKEMAAGSAPQNYKLWAKGFLYRVDLYGKPMTLRFVALDGREVDLTKMRGKVVLIDFWSTGCGGCIEQLPDIKAAYDKFHEQGFEVIGISFDSDEARLRRFLDEKGLPWPQAFDGKQGMNNEYGQEFGICAIPHLLLLDKKGCLRLDGFYYWPKVESAITNQLAEP